ncbi:MAG: asparagine synthase (glutamine-hydrolyzing) [Desulfonauticus sp.]|nr:asparagine synthase (glutamine-hydrolyzing) [Desulfonauticus sp.]
MCGIIGIASTEYIQDRDWLLKGRDFLFHRGPDDAGIWCSKDDKVALGHRRLSIIDLSEAAHQPMKDITERCVIVFNGEIYNFKEIRKKLEHEGYNFFSNSDTEVILGAYLRWGTDCLSYLNGMFAFAIFDIKEKKLFMARDRSGEKPLFYLVKNNTIKFASELKGLMADPAFPRKIDPMALDCYLSFRYVPHHLCILEGVRKLPPAHALVFDLNTGKIKIWQYWDIPKLDERYKKAEPEVLVEEMEFLLEKAVKAQLVADVPVGILLSGGIDSSLVTAMAARHVTDLKTFTVRFPGYGEYDETPHANLIADYFGTQHTTIDAEEYTVELLPEMAKQFDEPIVDSSMIPTYMVSYLVRKYCKVALGGDGGDELFGGYKSYTQLLWVENTLGRLPYPIRIGIEYGCKKFMPVGIKGRKWLISLGGDFKNSLPITSYFDASTRKALLSHITSWEPVAEKIKKKFIPQGEDILDRMTRMDFKLHLPDDILVKVDRCSMMNSLEVRSPFLDKDIIEFAFKKVPSPLKTTLKNRKILLKFLCKKILPKEMDLKRKQGFSIPLSTWLKKGPYRDFFFEVLTDSECIFNKKMVKKLFHAQDMGLNVSERLFAIVLFELWRKEYKTYL